MLSDNKQVDIVPNPNRQSAAILGRSFSITKSGLCVSVLLNTHSISITIQRGRKLRYALPAKTRNDVTDILRKLEVPDCPNHRDKYCFLNRLEKIKISSGFIKSETVDGLSNCSNFPERPTQEELELDKPVLPAIERLRGKKTDEQLEALKDVLDKNQDGFFRLKTDIGSCKL